MAARFAGTHESRQARVNEAAEKRTIMNLEKERKYRSPQLRLMVAVACHLFNSLVSSCSTRVYHCVALCAHYARGNILWTEGSVRYSRKECLACSSIETNLTWSTLLFEESAGLIKSRILYVGWVRNGENWAVKRTRDPFENLGKNLIADKSNDRHYILWLIFCFFPTLRASQLTFSYILFFLSVQILESRNSLLTKIITRYFKIFHLLTLLRNSIIRSVCSVIYIFISVLRNVYVLLTKYSWKL